MKEITVEPRQPLQQSDNQARHGQEKALQYLHKQGATQHVAVIPNIITIIVSCKIQAPKSNKTNIPVCPHSVIFILFFILFCYLYHFWQVELHIQGTVLLECRLRHTTDKKNVLREFIPELFC